MTDRSGREFSDRVMLLAAACALASAGVVGLALYAGCLWLSVFKL